MKQCSNFEKFIGLLMLIGAIVFNLWLYRLEPTAKIDPNDNTFQFALVDRTNQIWDFAYKSCTRKLLVLPVSLLTCFAPYLMDHWVPNWAEGYNLPFYYSHIPQILIVGSYRLFSSFSQFLISNFQFLIKISNFKFQISLFQYYHLVIYLLLSLFPLSVFLALLVLRLSPITAGIGALLASHLSTDGLYGLDPSSFLWRGYGLSSQLFAMIFLPLAIAYSYRYLCSSGQERDKEFSEELKIRSSKFRVFRWFANFHLARRESNQYDKRREKRASSENPLFERSLFLAVFFLVATTAGHLGIGIIAILSLIPLAFGPIVLSFLNNPSHNATLLHGYIVKKQNDIHQQCSNVAIQQLLRFFILTGTTLFFLSYWIVPIVLNNNYHNISFWDPIWKFDSYGWKETLIRLFNGDLFDFGRFPVLTILVFIGFFTTLWPKLSQNTQKTQTSGRSDNLKIRSSDPLSIRHSESSEFSEIYPYSPLAFLFPFWLLLYFGRTTWGNLIDLIPGMKEFHLSRFLVGIHIAGIFLIPLGVEAIASSVKRQASSVLKQFNNRTIEQFMYYFMVLLISGIIVVPVYRQTIKYNDLNNTLITKANENFMKAKPDIDELFRTLEPLKRNGRVFLGRGGSWGKDLQVAETPYYMHLSTYGINTVLWLPETWSLNSDTEQYFSEDQAKDYDLYNIKYVVSAPTQKPQPFWKLLRETKSWKLYEVTHSVIPAKAGIQSQKELIPDQSLPPTRSGVGNDTNNFGYFTAGIRPAIVAVDKESFINVVRLWIQSDYPKRGYFPELTFDKDYPKNSGLPNFKMLDEANYVIPARNASAPARIDTRSVSGRSVAGGPNGTRHNLFAEVPVYQPLNNVTIQQPARPAGGFNNVTILSQTNDSDMIFSAKISVPKDCTECILVLKQTSHPNWQVTIDGKRAQRLDVFPFFNAVKIPEGLSAQAGTHEVVFSYQPSSIKIVLLILEVCVLILLILNKVVSKQLKEI